MSLFALLQWSLKEEQIQNAKVYRPSYLWADVVKLAIAEPPQYVLRSITTNSKIQSMEWGKQFSPDLTKIHTDNSI